MENKNNSVNITIDINGKKIGINGVTRYTTCDDIIEMVFYNSPVEASTYALFESSRGIERMLYGKESVLKVVRSWGADRTSFTLLARKLDNMKTNTATLSLSQAGRKLRRMRSQNVNALPSKQDIYTSQTNLNKTGGKPDVPDKDIETTYPAFEKEKNSKLGLLKRFLSDVMVHRKKEARLRSRTRMTRRTPGDGCSESADSQNYRNYECMSLSGHNSYLNAAFVEGDDDSDTNTINTPMEVMSKSSISLDSESGLDSESAFGDYSICEFERNIDEFSDVNSEEYNEFDASDSEGPYCDTENTMIKCNRIIDIFRKAVINGPELETEDDYMASFMNTVVYNSDSDEGMGSLDSDTE